MVTHFFITIFIIPVSPNVKCTSPLCIITPTILGNANGDLKIHAGVCDKNASISLQIIWYKQIAVESNFFIESNSFSNVSNFFTASSEDDGRGQDFIGLYRRTLNNIYKENVWKKGD